MAGTSLPIMTDDMDGRSLETLVNADPDQAFELLAAAPGLSAIYRASHHVHQELRPAERRQLLALDAARFGARELSARILATPVPDAPAAEWRIDWATGSLVEPRLRGTINAFESSSSAVSPVLVDGRPHAVSGSHGGAVKLWDLTSLRQTGDTMMGGDWQEDDEDGPWVTDVATVEIDGRPHAVTGGTSEYLYVWDLTTRRQVRRIEAECNWLESLSAVAAGGRVFAVAAFSDDGSAAGMIQVWDLATGAELNHPGPAKRAEVTTTVIQGRAHAIAGFGNGALLIWDLATGREARPRLGGHGAEINTVTAVELDGRPHVIDSGRDGKAFLWDLTSGERVGGSLLEHPTTLRDVAVADIDGRAHAVLLDSDGTLSVVDPVTRREAFARLPVVRATSVATCALDGRPHAVTAHPDGTVRLWELSGLPSGHHPTPGHEQMISSVVVTELDGRPRAVSGAFEGVLRTWDVATGEPVGVLRTRAMSGDITHSLIAHEGREHVVVKGETGTAHLWDLGAAEPVGGAMTDVTPDDHTGVSAAPTLMFEGRPHTVLCYDSGLLRLWDLTTRTPTGAEPIDIDDYPDLAVAVEIGGSPHLLVCVLGGTMSLWDLATGRAVGELTGAKSTVQAAAVTDVGGRPHAVTACDDGTVRVWDLVDRVQAGEPVTAHEWGAEAVAVGEIGGRRVIVSGGNDQAVRVWDFTTRKQIGQDLRFTWKVFGVAIAPDERLVVAYGQELVALSPVRPGS